MSLRTLGHFDVLERIGKGGMGAVFRARDRVLERTVAIKLLLPEVNADEERRSRFLREARAAAALHHPNIATIFEVGEVRLEHDDLTILDLSPVDAPLDLPYIAMEYVEGIDLGRLMEEPGGVELDTVLDIVRQVLGALEEAHRAGVVHRDLKPANVMIAGDGSAKLLDFGLAKILRAETDGEGEERTISQLTLDGMVMGTLPYLAPEQLQSSRVDGQADLFSLGVILYEMLTGITPYPGSTMVEYARAVLIEDVRPPSELVPELPRWLDPLSLELLATEPTERPRAWQAAARIERHLRPPSDTETEPPPPADDGSSRDGRRFALGALAAAAALAAVLVLWVALGRRHGVEAPVRLDASEAFALGREHLAEGDLEQAQQYLGHAVARASDRPDPWYYLGEVYRRRGLDDFARAAYAQAGLIYEERLRQDPGDVEAAVWWSFFQAKQHACGPALERLDGLAESLPPSPEVSLAAARTYAVCQRGDDAESWLERAVAQGVAPGRVSAASELESLPAGD